MSCGEPHETDCSEVLDHLYEYLDREMPDGDCAKFKEHLEECSPCLQKYGLEQEVKKLVKRCCGSDDVPSDLRSKVMGRIELIRSEEQGAGAPPAPSGGGSTEAGTSRSASSPEQSATKPEGEATRSSAQPSATRGKFA